MPEEKKKDPNLDTEEGKTDEGDAPDELNFEDEGEELEDEEKKDKKTSDTEKVELSPRVKEYLTKKGIKNLDDLVASDESKEKKITQLSIDRKLMGPTQTTTMQPKVVDRSRESVRTRLNIPDDPYEMVTDKEKFTAFLNDVDKVIDEKVADGISEARGEDMKRRLRRIIEKDPEEFRRRLPTMRELANSYGDADIQDIYDVAGDVEKERTEEQQKELAKNLLGDEKGFSKLKTILEKTDTTAHISTGGGGDTQEKLSDTKKAEQEIVKAVLASDRLTD